MRSTIFFLFICSNVFGSYSPDSLPNFGIKFNPLAAFLEVDPHLQFSGEYFLSAKRSVQATFGFGNEKIFESSSNEKAMMFRLEHRVYFRPFSSKKKGRGYLSQEIMYKKVLEKKSADNISNPQSPSVTYLLNVNVAALHLKLGHEFMGQNGFPVLDVFLGMGVRTYNNYNQNLPEGYEFTRFTMYNRLAGNGTTLSAVVGVGIGVGSRKN